VQSGTEEFCTPGLINSDSFEQDRQCMYKHNIQACLRTIVAVEKQYVLHILSVSVALVIQDAMHMGHIILSCVACLTLPCHSKPVTADITWNENWCNAGGNTRRLGWFQSICGIPWIAVLGKGWSCCSVLDKIIQWNLYPSFPLPSLARMYRLPYLVPKLAPYK
jgi:hypothetical protein